MTRSSYLLIREDADRSFYALMSDAEPTQLLSSITLPTGADRTAVEATLQSAAGVQERGEISTVLRGDPSSLGRATGRCAEAFGVPVRIIDIAHDAGRVVWAAPGAVGELAQIDEAALVPVDPTERRRRCDSVLRSLGGYDRAAVADLLGDIADRPMSGRSIVGDQVRVAAYVDALQSLAERVGEQRAAVMGVVLIVTGPLAAHVASGAVPLAALSPLVPPGRSTVLLDTAGVLAALGTEQLSETTGVDLVRACADQLLLPAGDLLVITDRPDDVVVMRVRAEEHALLSDQAIAVAVEAGEIVNVEIDRAGETIVAPLRGGLAGAVVARGMPAVDVTQLPAGALSVRVLPIEASLMLLPRSASATGGLGGRLLLGDEVEGSLYFSASEPDSRGWAAAHEAGILAVVSVSPETVLRARAVGIRGLVVGSLSDGEREALSASIDRRVAAGVALAPFGLLVLGGRRESDAWAMELGKVLQGLNGIAVRLERHPAGLTTSVARGRGERSDVDTVVIGGPRAGAYGTWRGLADAQPSDPQGALEINGELVALPLGDLQRLTA